MEHVHQTMTASAKQLVHDHEDGEHAHVHGQDGETFHWIALVLPEEPEPEEPAKATEADAGE